MFHNVIIIIGTKCNEDSIIDDFFNGGGNCATVWVTGISLNS